MNLSARIKSWWSGTQKPLHLRHGELGERAARKQLKRQGLKFLTANFRSPRGEIDLIFRDRDCLVFVEVKTRSSEEWVRPAAAVDRERRQRLTRAALDYLRLLKEPAGEGSLRHRGSAFAGRRRAGSAALAEHLRDGAPLSVRVTPFRYA